MQIPVRLVRAAGYLLLSIVLAASFLANSNIGWQRYLYILFAPLASIWGGSATLLQRRCLSTFSRRKHFCQYICGCFSCCTCATHSLFLPAVPVGTSLCSYALKPQPTSNRKGGNYGHCSFCFYLKHVFGGFRRAFSAGAWCCHIYLNYRRIFDLSKVQAII